MMRSELCCAYAAPVRRIKTKIGGRGTIPTNEMLRSTVLTGLLALGLLVAPVVAVPAPKARSDASVSPLSSSLRQSP